MKKSTIISALNDLPKDLSLDDLFERLLVIEKIDQGLLDIKNGDVVDHDKVKKMVKRWQK